MGGFDSRTSNPNVPVATSSGPYDELASKQLAGRLQRELDRLPDAQREAFQLVKQDGLSMAEAAEVLGTTVTAVKLRAHHTYETLRSVMGDAISGAPGGSG